MDIQKILMHEMDSLRQELQHLKNCQVKYFLFSITVTGGVIAVLSRQETVERLGYLAPLLVIIPCWWIFFDKASSITRIVGYYRHLEKMILGQGTHRYLGWERALSEFRNWQENQKFDYKIECGYSEQAKMKKILMLRTANRYWAIIWYTFFSLAVFCVLLGSFPLGPMNTTLSIILGILVGYSAVKIFGDISELIFGKSSFYTNEQCWKQILEIASDKKLVAQIIVVQDTPHSLSGIR